MTAAILRNIQTFVDSSNQCKYIYLNHNDIAISVEPKTETQSSISL